MIESLLSNPWICIFAIIVGFVLLVYGADWLVEGASSVAHRLGVNDLIIGLTIVAFGTSMPEFIVSLMAAMEGNTEIAITNVLGSNSINTFVVLGLTAVICPVVSQRQSRRFEIPLSLIGGVLVVVFTLPNPIKEWAEKEGVPSITAAEGWILLIIFALFLWHSLSTGKKEEQKQEEISSTISIPKAIVLMLAGLLGLVVGGDAIVKSATSIAHQLHASEALIGLTIVALGTSLPELATSCIAATHHKVDLALGNVIGSNIFNVFFILGINAIIHPLPIYQGLLLDGAMVALSSGLVLLFVWGTKKHEIKRWHGAILLLIYACYLTYRIIGI